MSLESADQFAEIIIEEFPDDDCFKEVLEAIKSRLSIKLTNPGSGGIGVCRGEFTDTFIGQYCIREDASGNTIGLYKSVDGILRPIALPLPNEIKFMQGSGSVRLVPPLGWELITDPKITNKYNIGASPNWEVAAIRYVGI